MDTKRIIVDIPEDTHTRFKTIVVSQKSTIKGVILDFVEKYIEEHEKKKTR